MALSLKKDYSVSVLFRVINAASKPLKEVSTSFSTISKEVAGIKTETAGLAAFSDALGKLGRDLSLKVTAPLIALGVFATKSAMSLNELMSEIHTSIPDSDLRRIEKLKDYVQSLSMTYGKETTEVATGLRELIRVSGDNMDTMEKLRLATKTSVSSFASVTDAVHLATEASRAYGNTSLEEFKKVLHLGYVVKTSGASSFQEFALAIGRLLPTTARFGINIEEVSAAFATLSKLNPGAASRVGYQLSTLIEKMAQYPPIAARIKKVGFTRTLIDLRNALGDNMVAMRKFGGGSRSLAAFTYLLGFGIKDLESTLKVMEERVNDVNDGFNRVSNGINKGGYSFKQFTSTLRVFKEKLGDALLPFLILAMKALIPLLKWFNNLSDGTKTFITVLGMLAAALGPLFLIITSITKALLFWKVVLLVLAKFGGGALLGALVLPFVKILAIVAVVVGSIVGFIALVKSIKTKVIPALQPFFTWLDNKFEDMEKVTNRWKASMISSFKSIASSVWIFVKTKALETISIIVDTVKAAIAEIKKLFIWTPIPSMKGKSFFEKMFPGLPEYIKNFRVTPVEGYGRNTSFFEKMFPRSSNNSKSEVLIRVKNDSNNILSVDKVNTDPNSIINVYTDSYLGFNGAY